MPFTAIIDVAVGWSDVLDKAKQMTTDLAAPALAGPVAMASENA